MDSGKFNYFEKVDSPQHREFIISQNNCILCGTVLELRHIADEQAISIKEEAHCPECDVRTRAKTYSLN